MNSIEICLKSNQRIIWADQDKKGPYGICWKFWKEDHMIFFLFQDVSLRIPNLYNFFY